MEETKVLETALRNCQLLETTLQDTIEIVRRLNIRYNVDYFLKNYNNYIANIWNQYQCKLKKETPIKNIEETSLPSSPSSISLKSYRRVNHPSLAGRSASELMGNSVRINYTFIKIKRSMETVLLEIHRAIDIANRQRNYTHFNINDRENYICCH
ncbi:uncharacterized protein ACN427_009061 isoform 1-T1 [Glossina fuscipes fuscipes]|uniref:Uncharacterized protein n=1 Tax=Glossina palpalis gambiensis TaxID=67801 RepID=A0A1B0C5J0_9MUSC